MNKTVKTTFIFLLLLLPALLLGLGERPVYKIQEVRIAETAREMVESGDWVVPRYNGELRLQKPPLPYWLTAASYKIADASAEATRWPAAAAGLCLALLLGLWAWRTLGAEAACNSVIVLIFSYLGLRYFRSGEADALLLLCISAACKLGFDILDGRREPWRRLLFGLMLGLGFLSKGPAGLSIPLLALLLMAILERRSGRSQPKVAHFFSLPGIIALLLAAFGWYAWIIWSLPEASQHFFGKQIDETFISGNHAKPLWWYITNWAGFLAPWGILIVPAGVMAYRQRHHGMPALIRFAWIWLAVVFVLLTATVNKQTQYALLFVPPLALIVGHYLATAEGKFRRANQILFSLLCMAAAAGIVVAIRKSAGMPSPLWLAIPLVPLLLARLLAVRALSWPVLLTAGLTSMAFLYSEAYLSKEPNKVAAQSLMREAASHSPLFQLEDKPGKGELSFYAGRVVKPVGMKELPALLDRHPEVWLVGEDFDDKAPELAKASLIAVRQVDDLRLVKLTRQP